jgi:LCP family protein required for cell wall assembly
VTVAALVPGIAGAWVASRQDSLLDTVFVGSDHANVAVPSPLGELGITAPPVTPAPTIPSASSPSTTAPTTVATTATTPPRTTVAAKPAARPAPVEAGRWNIALLGGDAGPRRRGLRTDTMIVVSIDRGTGDLASISVPRNLQRLPMPKGVLRKRFPSGFNNFANALYPYVATHPDLHLDPSESIKGALAELLGIPIDNYVLVDMAGFIKIIDALGGVTVDLSARVPLVPNIDGRTKEAPAVGPGPVRMNGKMALSFVRTREADSDYQRMKRQRCLLVAVARKTSPVQLAKSYLSLVGAVEGAFRSDIPRARLGELVRLFAKVHVDNARTLVLVPPVITPAHPDIARIRSLVAETLAASLAATSTISKPSC